MQVHIGSPQLHRLPVPTHGSAARADRMAARVQAEGSRRTQKSPAAAQAAVVEHTAVAAWPSRASEDMVATEFCDHVVALRDARRRSWIFIEMAA